MLTKSLSSFATVGPQKLTANTQTKTKERVMGSWKNKVTATELVEERANCDFDRDDLAQGLLGDELLTLVYDTQNDMKEYPAIAIDQTYYEMTPTEKQIMWFKKLNYIWFNMPEKRKKYFITNPSLRF